MSGWWERLGPGLGIAVAQGRATLRADLRQRIAQDSLIVLLGHLVRLGLGLVSSAILARGLGPDGLSIFAVVGAATSIIGTVADFGLRLSAIRYIAAGAQREGEAGRVAAAAYARWKLWGSLLLAGGTLAAAGPLARLLNLPPESGPWLVRLGALAMLATLLSGVLGTVLHALRRFAALTVTQSANVALTVALFALLWWSGRLTVGTALVVGGVTAVAAGALGYWLMPARWRQALRTPVSLRGAQSRELLSFSGWLWVSNIFSIVAVQVDVLLLNQWLAPALVGIYALARNLAFKADVLNQTLHSVLAPNVSALSQPAELRAYARRALSRSLLLALLFVPALPFVRPFIVTVYGQPFAEAANVFFALMAVILLDLLASPLVLLALPLNRPRLLALSDGVQVVLLFAVGAWAVPHWGVYGIVVARFVAKAVGMAVTLGPVWGEIRGLGIGD